jgi:hypothetical protein
MVITNIVITGMVITDMVDHHGALNNAKILNIGLKVKTCWGGS